jgi:hypothetical protein
LIQKAKVSKALRQSEKGLKCESINGFAHGLWALLNKEKRKNVTLKALHHT